MIKDADAGRKIERIECHRCGDALDTEGGEIRGFFVHAGESRRVQCRNCGSYAFNVVVEPFLYPDADFPPA